MGICRFCGKAASTGNLRFDFPVCEQHQRKVEAFLKSKDEMKVAAEDMRVLERFLKDNRRIVKCPLCNGGMFIHHWKKEKDGSRVPIFKCRICDFLV